MSKTETMANAKHPDYFALYSSSWDENFGLLCHFKSKYGTTNVPLKHSDPMYKYLGYWTAFFRRHKSKLNEHQTMLLEASGFDFDGVDGTKHRPSQPVKDASKEDGGVPSNEDNSVPTQKATSCTKEDDWQSSFDQLCKYLDVHGTIQRIPPNKTSYKLICWLNQQRSKAQFGILSYQRAACLLGVGVRWEELDSVWDYYFQTLQSICESNGNSISDVSPQIQNWMKVQTILCKNSLLPADRRDRLMAFYQRVMPACRDTTAPCNNSSSFTANAPPRVFPCQNNTVPSRINNTVPSRINNASPDEVIDLSKDDAAKESSSNPSVTAKRNYDKAQLFGKYKLAPLLPRKQPRY
mgnify:CR=1 FL=1